MGARLLEQLGLSPATIEKLGHVLGLSPDPLVLIEHETGRFLGCNPPFEHAVRRAGPTMLGRLPEEFGLWVDPEDSDTAIDRFSDDEAAVTYVTALRRGDGVVHRFEVTAKRFQADGLELRLSALRDVEVPIRLREQLQATERRFRAGFHESPAFHALLDSKLRVIDINEAACRYVGIEHEDALGRSFTELYDRPDIESPEIGQFVLERLLAGETVRIPKPEHDSQSRRAYIEGHFTPMFLHDGRIEMVLVSGTEVTEKVLLEREMIQVAERERERIGAELHDGVGQLLVGAIFALQALRKPLTQQSAEIAAEVQRCVGVVQQAHQQIRYLSQGLTTAIPEGSTVNDNLAALAKTVRELFGIECFVESEDDSHPIDTSVIAVLVQITREAITNAVRHGRARDIRLRWHHDERLGHLEIDDDGTGFDPRQIALEGQGTRIMRSRALQIGATLRFLQSARGGTVVRVQWESPGRPLEVVHSE